MRRIAALLTAPVFVVLAACGDAISDDDETATSDLEEELPDDVDPMEDMEEVEPAEDDPLLDAVTVSGEVGEPPEVEIDGEVVTEETVRRVDSEGDGEPFSGEAIIDMEFVLFNGADGEEIESSYDLGPAPMSAAQVAFEVGIGEALLEAPIGSRVVAAMPPLESGQPMHPDLEGDETVVAVFDLLEPRERAELPAIEDLEATRAEGEEVTPEGENLPEVTLGDDGEPTIEVPDTDPPEELVSELLIEGDGDEVPRGATVIIQYTGVLWDDGTVFDSTWELGEPATFGLTQLVEGWARGLAGYPVGSQVLLVIPPELGYGEQGAGEDIPPDATLVFVVDILATD